MGHAVDSFQAEQRTPLLIMIDQGKHLQITLECALVNLESLGGLTERPRVKAFERLAPELENPYGCGKGRLVR
jgi:hypothetical protein